MNNIGESTKIRNKWVQRFSN